MFGMYNPQTQLDRWTKIRNDADNEIKRLTQIPAAINQNFNIVAPNQNDFDAKFINNFDEVKQIEIHKNTIFMNKNEPIFYIKTIDGKITSYEFKEIIILDEKDKKILELERKVELLMKGDIHESDNEDDTTEQQQSFISTDEWKESTRNNSNNDKRKSKFGKHLETSSTISE